MASRNWIFPLLLSLAWVGLHTARVMAQATEAPYLSHSPLRSNPPPSQRPLADGPAYFVAPQGDDEDEGTEEAPWATLGRAMMQLKAGDTLYLRQGVYHENLQVRLVGREDAPITLRAYPGEQAVIDGSLPEFSLQAHTAWQPFPQGGPDEYRSTRPYPNLRAVMGWFGDSLVGLNTYHHAQDLRATQQLWNPLPAPNANPSPAPAKDGQKQTAPQPDVEPVYCGPGLWYDPATGYLHVRLSHTSVPGVQSNYRGETDPRKLPLLIAPFRSLPLHVDGAQHCRFQDLVLRGGGYYTCQVDHGKDIQFENVTFWAGSYGLEALRTQNLKLLNCGFYGSVPPWLFRADTSLRSYPQRGHRDITRFNTHALLVADAGREFSVFALPINDDWEIAHCEFTDAHDGLYLGGINVNFHHNLVYNMQDDGIYLSPMYPRYSPRKAVLHVSQNYIARCLTALAFGGTEDTQDTVYIYRNILELREPISTGRPSTQRPEPAISFGKFLGDHGSPPWSTLRIYHNTMLMKERPRTSDMTLFSAAHAERPRYVFNNILVTQADLPAFRLIDHVQEDGNLYWSPKLDAARAASYFERYRKSPAYEQSKQTYAAGNSTHSRAADPQFQQLQEEQGVPSDFRLRENSPAVNAGVPLPADWPDPLRDQDAGAPDVGALPLGVTPWKVGRQAPE